MEQLGDCEIGAQIAHALRLSAFFGKMVCQFCFCLGFTNANARQNMRIQVNEYAATSQVGGHLSA